MSREDSTAEECAAQGTSQQKDQDEHERGVCRVKQDIRRVKHVWLKRA